jgi:hypothetical protein
MVGHGSKFGRKKEAAIAALLTQRNIEEAAKAAGIGANTLLRWIGSRVPDGLPRGPARGLFSGGRQASARSYRGRNHPA